MDNSYWLNSNPGVAFLETKKQFFGKYTQRVVYKVPGVYFINKVPVDELCDAIAARNANVARVNYKYGNSYGSAVDAAMIQLFGALKKTHTQLKYRIELSSVSIYSNDETELKSFNDEVSAYADTLQSVTGPRDIASQQLLESGHILGPNKTGYKYKVIFSDGRQDPAVKKQLIAYLDNLGDSVQVPNGTRTRFTNGFSYGWGNYIYINDISILTFISIIMPGLVGKVHELTKI